MKPSDALQQDWRLYYDQSWMKHSQLGPGKVKVAGNSLYFFTFPNDVIEPEGKQVSPSDLSCWWPRSGAYNFPGSAVYVARKSTRSMRKSAHPTEHYVIKWGTSYDEVGPNTIMLHLRKGPSLVEADYAIRVLNDGLSTSVAVSHDIILSRTSSEALEVIFKGITVGTLEDGLFRPDYNRSALVRRAQDRLMQEGII